MEEDNRTIDSENWRGNKQSYGFKDIVMRQLQKVVTNSSQEMRAGFWLYSHPSPAQSGEKIKYVGDSRKELVRSIDVLHDLLQPKFDDAMIEQSKLIYVEIKEWKEKCLDKQEKKEKDIEVNYWVGNVDIYRKLFQQLCYFLERMGWLETDNLEE